jgi:hypothetical protein
MGPANSRSCRARVSVLAITDSAAKFCRAGAPPATRGFQFKISARQAMRLPFHGFKP